MWFSTRSRLQSRPSVDVNDANKVMLPLLPVVGFCQLLVMPRSVPFSTADVAVCIKIKSSGVKYPTGVSWKNPKLFCAIAAAETMAATKAAAA